MQRGQEFLKRAAGQRIARGRGFPSGEGVEPTGLVYALGFVGEDDRIAIKGNAQFVGLVLVDAGKDRRRGIAFVERR